MPPRLRHPVALVVAATALGVTAAAWLHIIASLGGEPAPFLRTLALVMPFWYLWALYAPLVVWMGTHRPIERGRAVGRSFTHLGLAMVMSFLHTGIRFGLQPAVRGAMDTGASDASAVQPFLGLAVLELPVNVLIYGMILGVTYLVGYYRRLQERELAATRLSAQLADARMQALRMQLNPHFLFNALNSIAMLIRDEKRDAAVDTLEGLSDLLRYVLEESADQEVQLQHELDFVHRYLEIEKIRFQDRLDVKIDADKSVLEALVPTFVLQPIVENAIRHGVRGRDAVSTVTVTARREADSLRLGVLDEGPGFSGVPSPPQGIGLGIRNTRKRLAQLYGDEATLDTADRSPRGATVTITLPFHTVPLATDLPA
jgi:two-component sensor histidine kinase